MTAAVKLANPRACAACPWRLSNQGTRHPGGWYTKANLRRLWSKLRTGERMTCHPTDSENPLPPGYKPVAATAVTHECTGATILQEREYMRFQNIALARPPGSHDGFRIYRQQHPHGLTRDGVAEIINAVLFGGVWARGIAKPDLSDPDVGYLPLGLFDRAEVKR